MVPAITDPQRDERMQYTNDWFIRTVEGRHNNPRESTEQLFTRLLLPMGPRKRILETGVCEGRSFFWFIKNFAPDVIVGVDPWIPIRRGEEPIYTAWRQNFFHNFKSYMGCPLTEFEKNKFTSAFESIDCTLAMIPSREYLQRHLHLQLDTESQENPFRFDLIYVDGDHSSRGALRDMVLGWDVLAKDGLMVVDDFDRRWLHGRPAVHEAILAFWTVIESEAEKVYEGRRQVWFKKR